MSLVQLNPFKNKLCQIFSRFVIESDFHEEQQISIYLSSFQKLHNHTTSNKNTIKS